MPPPPARPRAVDSAPSLPSRARLAALVGTGLAGLSRASGRGSGSVIGGHAIMAIEPRALTIFSAGHQVVLVSGTNGKTTTTRLLASALAAAAGTGVVTNLTGANLPTGLATALCQGHRQPGAPAVLEVDEAWLGRVSAQVRPAAMVLLNLSRDQLDRNNEVRHVAQRWRQACQDLPPGAVVVANADDPLVAWAASAAAGPVTWVGAGLTWRNDAVGCPRCAGPIVFAARPEGGGDEAGGDDGGAGASSGGASDWKCDACGFGRPRPDLWLDATVPGGRAVMVSGEGHDLGLQLPGRCNQANAVTVLGAVLALGYPAPRSLAAVTAMAAVREVEGRYASIDSGATSARLLLAKNPAGWAEVFDMLAPPPGPVVVAINARTADGHDPSWLWDVSFERLAGRSVVATGERHLDLAVRLHYAGVEHVAEPDLVRAVEAGGPGKVDVVANYTSFHQLLTRLRTAGTPAPARPRPPNTAVGAR